MNKVIVVFKVMWYRFRLMLLKLKLNKLLDKLIPLTVQERVMLQSLEELKDLEGGADYTEYPFSFDNEASGLQIVCRECGLLIATEFEVCEECKREKE